jgi:drug/metabolite transporter (DMT)-like permease
MLTFSLTAALLSIGCGLGFAAADYFRKAVPAETSTALVLFYFIGLQLPLWAGWLWASGETRLTADYWLPGIIDVVLGLGANFTFIAAVRRSPLSLMIPMLALVPVLTTVAGAAMLTEIPSLMQVGGIVLIFVGLLALYAPAGQGARVTAALRAMKSEPGMPLMLATIAGWSLTPVFDKMCVAASSVPMHATIQVGAITALVGAWIVLRGGVMALKPNPGSAKPLVGAAVAAALAYGLQLAAYQMAMVALVEGLKRVTGLLAAVAVGRIMFHEPLTRAKLVGVGVLAVGVPMILLG